MSPNDGKPDVKLMRLFEVFAAEGDVLTVRRAWWTNGLVRLLLLFTSCCAIWFLSGCSYSALGRVYDGQETDEIALTSARPRKPLRASISYEKVPDRFGGDNERYHSEEGFSAVVKRLEDSGYFASVRERAAADDDVRIVFGGTWCTYYSAHSPVTILVGMLTLPLLEPVPGKQAENHCDMRFSYSLRGVWEATPEATASENVRYGYMRSDYTIAPWWKWVYTGDSRQERQWDYLMDQAVAKLLNKMVADWNQKVAARYRKGASR